MKRSTSLFVLASIVVIAGIVVTLMMTKKAPAPSIVSSSQNQNPSSPAEPEQKNPSAQIGQGVYKTYSETAIADARYQTTVLFFHAGWCIECRGFEMAINDGTVPSGTQILKVDYDTNQDLRKKYNVTLQSTFVRVDNKSELLKKWVGYGKEKSVDVILDNVK